TDGDLDIAYALLLADRVWGSKGEFDYRKEARQVIDALAERVVSRSGRFLTFGDWARDRRRYGNATRSSDFAVEHLRAFEKATGSRRWAAVRSGTYDIV